MRGLTMSVLLKLAELWNNDSHNLFSKKDIIRKSIPAIVWVPEALIKALEVGFWAIQWIFDLSKFLGTAKNFLKSKIFLKSNILKQWNMQVLVGYEKPAQKIELFSCSIALLFLFRMLSHDNKQC